eukprot:scaffold111950_cov15-Tisochrysis_lutea.AAC.1
MIFVNHWDRKSGKRPAGTQKDAAAHGGEWPKELDEYESYEDDWYGEIDEEMKEPVFEVIAVTCWLDGCTSFEEIITCLKGYQMCFREMQKEGWVLASGKVQDGLIHIKKSSSIRERVGAPFATR